MGQVPRLGDQKAKPASLAVHIFGPFPARFSLKQKLFPPIPQVKQDLASSFMSNLETAWDGGHPAPGSQDPEDILTVEETRCFAR